MIYLSQLHLNGRLYQVQRDLSDCHELHRSVLRAFPEVPSGVSARDHYKVLHRVDVGGRSRPGIALLVQSSVQPDWAFLPSGYLEAGTSAMIKRVDDVYHSLTPGSTLRFRLRANPTRRVWKIDEGIDPAWKGKRVDLRREEDQVTWLRRKGQVDQAGQAGGFQVLDVDLRPGGTHTYTAVANVSVTPADAVHGKRGAGRLTFGSVLFDGVLRVTDVAAFNGTLVHGIGSGKAYGFGLLSIAPA